MADMKFLIALEAFCLLMSVMVTVITEPQSWRAVKIGAASTHAGVYAFAGCIWLFIWALR